jgi:hypothetical protein
MKIPLFSKVMKQEIGGSLKWQVSIGRTTIVLERVSLRRHQILIFLLLLILLFAAERSTGLVAEPASLRGG